LIKPSAQSPENPEPKREIIAWNGTLVPG
jgi:hypothetical protein